MEPFDREQMSDPELDAMLPRWQTPPAPAILRRSVFQPWWKRWWSLSIRVPLPVACALAVLVCIAAIAWWRTEPRVVTQIVRVETPVSAWKPVTELRPRIIRHENRND